jgi:DNA-binding MarR family transcriptional regulator
MTLQRKLSSPAVGLNGHAVAAAAPPHAASALDGQVGDLIRRAHLRASAIFATELDGHQLSAAQYLAMVPLFELGQLSRNHLAQRTAMSRMELQCVVKQLQARGLLEALADDHDRRRIVLQLSAAGRAMVEQLQARIGATNDQVLAPLGPAERVDFLRLLRRLT